MNDDLNNMINALEKSIDNKIDELKELVKNNAKFQHQLNLREEIYKKQRTLAQLKQKRGKQ